MADEQNQAPRQPRKLAPSSSPAPRREGGGHGGPAAGMAAGGGPRWSAASRRRPRRSGGGPGGPRRGKRQFFRKKKVCKFCVEKMDFIDYKRADILSQFVQERGKILPRRMTGVCARHQRWLGVAIKRARNIALLPFAGSAAGSSAPRPVDPRQAASSQAAHRRQAASSRRSKHRKSNRLLQQPTAVNFWHRLTF